MPTIPMSSTATAWKGEITWSSTQSTSSNTSTVYASVSTWKTDGQASSSSSGAYFKGTLYVGDESVSFSFQQQERSSQWQAELEVTISHASDGTGNVYIYCEIDAPYGVSMYNKPLKGGGTYSLPTIPRSSSVSSYGTMYFGDPCKIAWTPASSSFYYKLKFSIGSWSNTTEAIRPGSTDYYQYNGYTIPLEQASQSVNSTSIKMSVSLYSYSDSSCNTQIGSTSTKTFSIYVPDSVVPQITEHNISFVNNTNATVDSWGIGIVGYSGIRISASAIGAYGSTIVSFEISGSYTATPIAKYENESDKTSAYLEYSGQNFSSSGNKSFTIKCVDSRGRKSNPIEINSLDGNPIRILSYKKPEITSLSTTKNDKGTTSTEDDRMVVTATWEYDPVDGYNSASGKVYYKESNATDWTEHPGAISNNKPYTLDDLRLDDEKSYNIQVVVTDMVGESDDESSFSSTTQVLLDFRAGGKGLGIGKICESDSMEVSMDATFYNDLYLQRDSITYDIETYIKKLAEIVLDEQKTTLFNGIYPIGSIYVSTKDINPYVLFGIGAWERIKDRFLFAAIDESDILNATDPDNPDLKYLAGQSGGEKEHVLTIDEMPEHNHWGAARPDYAIYSGGGTHPSAVMDDNNINNIYTNPRGSGEPHNNMPPYLAVYMWKRTA